MKFHTMNMARRAKVCLLYFWLICWNIVCALTGLLVINGSVLWFGLDTVWDNGGLGWVFFVSVNLVGIYFFWKSLKFDGDKSFND